VKFPQIGDVSFKREEGAVGFLHIIRPEPDQFEGCVSRPVEEHVVIGHVEMPVVVDPLVFDLLDRRFERGRVSHRKSPDFCYC
jgi:hypothetical protein